MTQEPLRRAAVVPRFLSFPIRRSLEGVSWASLSVEWRPTEDQKQQRREQQKRNELEALWLPHERPTKSECPESRLPLHPLGCRRFPFERLYSRLGHARTAPRPAERFASRSRSGLQSPPLP